MIWDFEQFSLISFKIACSQTFSCLVDLTKLNSIKIQKKHHQSLCSSPSHPPTPYVCVYISFVVTTYRCTTRKVTYRDMFLVVAKNFNYQSMSLVSYLCEPQLIIESGCNYR